MGRRKYGETVGEFGVNLLLSYAIRYQLGVGEWYILSDSVVSVAAKYLGDTDEYNRPKFEDRGGNIHVAGENIVITSLENSPA